MKNIKKHFHAIVLLLGLLISTNACEDLAFGDKFLQKPPSTDVTIDTVFSTAEYARRVLWYSYRYLPMGLETSNSYWNTMWLGNIEGLTDLNQDYLGYSGVNKVYYAGNYNAGTENSPRGTYMATKIRFNENETHMWSAIRNAWLIVANIDRVPDMDRTEKERLKAEAKAMVAVYYAHMLRHYGGLPIIDKVISPDEASMPTRATLQQTVDFIVRLLNEAIDCPEFPWHISEAEMSNWDGRLTKAGAMGTISEEQFVGVDLSMDNTFYKNNLFEDYTSVELNPYYLYQSEDWKIRLGAHVDFAFGFGKKFRVAPDVTAQYIFSDSYILYAQATGGRQANDFRRLEMVSPYGQSNTQLDATYEQLNAALGFKTSPVTGLWFNIYGGYQDLKNNLASAAIANYSGSYLQLLQGNMHNIYAGAEASYSYKDIISFTASGIYRDWKTAKTENNSGDQLLYYMPSFEANFKVDIRPISSVLINLGYQHITREKIGNERVDPVGNLYLGGSYEVFEGISIYVRANNLLNKDYQYYPGYPTEGINFMGGVSFRF